MNSVKWLSIVLVTVLSWVMAGCGGSTQSYAPIVDVTSSANFTITGGPAQTSGPGGTTTFTINTAGGQTQKSRAEDEPIKLTILSGLPANANASLSPTSVLPGNSSTLTITTASNTAPQNYDIVVQGTSGGVSKTTTVRLTVNSDFFINGGGGAIVLPGDSATFTITPSTSPDNDRPGRGPNDVTYEVLSGLPTGATTSFSPAQGVINTAGTFTVQTGANSPPGNYSVQIRGTWGNQTATKTLSLTIQAQDFFLSAPSNVSTAEDVAIDIPIQVLTAAQGRPASRGPNDVNLTITSTIPAGFTATILQSPVAIGSSGTLRVSFTRPALNQGPPVTGVFTVEGSNASFQRSVTVSVFVSQQETRP